MAQMMAIEAEDDPRKEITINEVPLEIEKTNGAWRIKKPLVDGKKKIAGSTHMGVKPSDKTWKNFKKHADRIDIGKPDFTGKSLEKLIIAIVEYKKKGYRNQDFVDELLFKQPESVSKYLKVADWVGLWNYDLQQATKKKTDVKPHLQKGVSKELGEKRDKRYYDDPLIQAWVKDFHRNDTDTYHRYMFNALKILDMTPSQLAYESFEGTPQERLSAIKDRIFPLRYWSENPYAKNPATKSKRSLKPESRFAVKAKKIYLDPKNIRRLKHDVGWEKLIETEGKHKGKIAVGDRNNNTMYNFAKVIRNFLSANVKRYPDVDETDILSQEAPAVAQYGKLKLSWDQIQGMRACLLKGIKEDTKIINLTKSGKFYDAKGKIDLSQHKKNWSVKSYWQDAYFFFMLSVEMGMRAEEGFDIIAEEPLDEQSSGVTIETEGSQKYYKVFLYTRKTEEMDEGRIHEGIIPNSPDGDIVKKLIDDRKAEIKKGRDIDKQSKIHALIGADNKYTGIETISLPTDQVTKFEVRRRIIKNILRHCYQEVDAASTFYYDRPVHALRHVFAQYWLNKSGYNYTFVMKLGHWTTLKTLEKSYGKMDMKIFALDHNVYANIDPSKPYAQRLSDIEAARKSAKEPEPFTPTATAKVVADKFIKSVKKAHFDKEPEPNTDELITNPLEVKPDDDTPIAEIK